MGAMMSLIYRHWRTCRLSRRELRRFHKARQRASGRT